MVRTARPWRLVCVECDRATDDVAYECPDCAGTLLAAPEPPVSRGRADLLVDVGECVDLGQGDTPLVPVAGRPGVLAKLESLNPTLSFKDRAMSLGAALAVRLGARGLVVASTGNAAVSAAAYAAAAGLRCRVVVGSASHAGRKLAACAAYGAEVAEVEGDYSDAYARAAAEEGDGWVNVSTTYRNPILAEAYRLIAFELLDQLGVEPAVVVVPIGAGPLLRGIERGFADAVCLGLVARVPRLVGVQAAAMAPIARFWAGASLADLRGSSWSATSATAIADPLRGYESAAAITAAAVGRTGGEVVAVGEGAISEAVGELAASGVWVEPGAATALAASDALGLGGAGERRGTERHVDPGGPVVLMLTGHGAKAQGPA
ncbi:threonine synthase [Salana multivorans]|uniref:Threonine synthase n=1 Tax=Salana multivorans TaxID=120377 RepID=A0A3N2D8M2_9MICO|nr:pyridoxal-phosphate dependent enzyme [Salana multivorans]ROR96136.1 threonine synthase [Salana multivorans]